MIVTTVTPAICATMAYCWAVTLVILSSPLNFFTLTLIPEPGSVGTIATELTMAALVVEPFGLIYF